MILRLDPVATIDATRAAAQVIDACRYGDAELVITLPPKMAILANTVIPESLATLMAIGNRLLPGPAGNADSTSHSGWQSLSAVSNSLTHSLTHCQ